MKIERYAPRHFEGVKALWAEVNPGEPPWNAAEVAIPLKLGHQPELFLVATEHDVVIGTTIAGFDGHRGWVHAVAVKASHRRKGVARALMAEAVQALEALGCPKINLQVVAGNETAVRFYQSLGFQIEDRVSMGLPIGRFKGASPRRPRERGATDPP